jgi:integrase
MQFTKVAIDALAVPEGRSEVLVWDRSMPGFGVRVRFGGSRTWVCQFRIGTQQRRETLGDVRKVRIEDARKIARQRFAQAELGVDPRASRKPTIALRKAVALYLDVKRDRMRPATRRQAIYHFTRLWQPLHNRPLAEIKRSDVAQRLQEIVQECGRTTAARARTNLSALFTWAVSEGVIESNPVANIANPAAGIKPRERVLDDNEIRLIWDVCQDNTDFNGIVKLLLLLGLRRGEAGALRWNEVNFDVGVLTIPGTRTKNHRELRLPLPAMARDILRKQPRREGTDFVFPGPRGGKVGFNAWGYSKLLLDNRVTSARGEALPHWTLHDARRSFRTGLGRLGIPPHIAELCINHVKGGVEAVYDKHTYQPQIGAALAAWAAHIEQLVTGGKPDRIVALRA